MKNTGIPENHPRVCFAHLFKMSDNISYNLSNKGYNVVKYLPFGPVNKVIPYLIRRAEENTSVANQTTREIELIKTELKRRKQA
jgi:proline dehydrogenase